MANKSYSQPKKSAGKIVAATACVLALAVGACAIGIGTEGFKDWSFSRWFPKEEVVQTAPDNKNGGTTLSEGESNGMVMAATVIPLNAYEEYGITELAENAYSLSVTYTPTNTTFQQTTYSAKFADGTDCSAYATITQSEEGSKTATFTILKPFSQQIVITATCDRNTDLKAKTKVDYVGAWHADLTDWTFDDIDSDIEVICSGMVNGTVSPEFDECFTLTFYLNNYFQTGMKAKGYDIPSTVSYDFSLESIGSSEGITSYRNIILKAGGYTSTNTDEAKAYWNDACTVLLNGVTPDEIGSSELFSYSIQSERVYNGVTYSTYICSSEGESSIELRDWSGFEIVATSISTDTPIIIAG